MRSSKTRSRSRVAGNLSLDDVARDGRVLLSHATPQIGIVGRAAGAPSEIDLSWLDWSLLADISFDGRMVLFSEAGEGGGRGYSVYVRGLDGAPAVRLGEGSAQRLSPDGKRVLALVGPPSGPDIAIYPTGAGEAKKIPASGLVVRGASWFPDGRRILVAAREPGKPPRSFVFDADGGKPRAITAEGYRGTQISPDGTRFVCFGPDGATFLCPIEGTAPPVKAAGIAVLDGVPGWASNDRLYVRRGSATRIPLRLEVVDPATGRAENPREFVPADATGLNAIQGFRMAPNGAYAYSYYRNLSNLYLVEGVK